jgi:hypothetical protein
MTRKLANSIFTLMMLLSLILMACDPTPQGPTVTPSPAPGQATYEKADCPFPNKPSGVSVECGYLVVPEDRSNPSSPMIKVAVAVFKSTSATPEPDRIPGRRPRRQPPACLPKTRIFRDHLPTPAAKSRPDPDRPARHGLFPTRPGLPGGLRNAD